MNRKYLPIAIGTALVLPFCAIADDDDDDDELPFAVAEVFFELNNTDGDLGIHALIDGDPWKRMQIFDKNERRMLNVSVRGRLRRQGLTEIFFESAEPTFDNLPPATFFARFPEGTYEIEGKTLDGVELESETEITHAMPAPPDPTVNGMPVALQCDDEEPGYDAPTVAGDVVIAWDPVTHTHPSLGHPQNAPGLTIHNYQLVVEAELELPNGDEFVSILSVVVPPDVTEVTVPAEFLEQSDTFKYEVLARETSWNQTAIESCFVIEGDE
ncbi:MAG: hypothetical protein AAFN50_02880 [Pseudomonadota bacterium]